MELLSLRDNQTDNLLIKVLKIEKLREDSTERFSFHRAFSCENEKFQQFNRQFNLSTLQISRPKAITKASYLKTRHCSMSHKRLTCSHYIKIVFTQQHLFKADNQSDVNLLRNSNRFSRSL